MASTNVFDRATDDETEDAVTVVIWELDGNPVAYVDWPAYAGPTGNIITAVSGEPMPVPVAFNKAIEAMKVHGLSRIIVEIERDDLWDPEWGTLRS